MREEAEAFIHGTAWAAAVMFATATHIERQLPNSTKAVELLVLLTREIVANAETEAHLQYPEYEGT